MTSLDDIFLQANQEWDAGNEGNAFALLRQAALAGHASAQNTLGYFYDHGIGTRKSRRSAIDWYRKAARLGEHCAFGNIGLSYRAAKKERLAKVWFKKALNHGDDDAALQLAKIYLAHKSKSSQRKAIAYLKIASASEHLDPTSLDEARQLLKEFSS